MDLFPHNNGDEWGFIGHNVEFLIPPIYEEVDFFSDGVAAVFKDGYWSYIDSSGNKINEYQYQNAEKFYYGKAWVKQEGSYSLVNKRGEILKKLGEDFTEHIDNLSSNMYRFCRNNKYGYLNQFGELQIDSLYDEAGPFINGIALVSKDGKSNFINTDGIVVLDSPEYTVFESFSEGMAQVLFASHQYGYINHNGDIIIPPSPRLGSEFSEGKTFYFDPKSMKYGYINTAGDTIINARFDAALPFINGLAYVREGKKSKLINDNNLQVFSLPHDSYIDVESYCLGLRYFTINVKGKKILFSRESGLIE